MGRVDAALAAAQAADAEVGWRQSDVAYVAGWYLDELDAGRSTDGALEVLRRSRARLDEAVQRKAEAWKAFRSALVEPRVVLVGPADERYLVEEAS